jgi:large subunit ribosomal protein L35
VTFLIGEFLMPKLKTHKGTARRFSVTGSGKLLRTKHGKSHLRRNKSKRAARQYDEMLSVARPDRERVKKLIPYGA